MNNPKKKVTASVFIALLFTYAGYVIAACTDENGILSLNSVIQRLPERLNKPFFFHFTAYSFQGILYGAGLGAFMGVYYYYTRKNWRFGEEYGSAKWGNVHEISKKLTTVPSDVDNAPYNRILSANLRMNMSDKVTDLNNNILLVAGPGKGKTFKIISPNLLCCNGSIVVTDPKKELLRTYGNYLKEHGYEVKVIDLIDFELSDCYNPFCHIRSRNDIPELISLLWDSMEDTKAQKGDPVWDDSAKSLIEGFAYYMFYEMEPEKRTFRTLASLLTDLSASDRGIKNMTKTMQALLQSEPAHPAAVKFLQAMNGAENTVKSVLFSATAKMSKLEDEKLLKIFDHDTIDFAALGMGYEGNHKKTALFFCISDGDTRWNFVVSIAVMQAFKELYYAADHRCADSNGKLPIPVSCWLDEFRNVPLPNTFPQLLSTMRGRNISSIITIQDPSQLEGLYDKENRTVRGDCDTIIYMGGNEHETHKWISEMLGKTTVDKRSTSVSHGMHGSESRSDDVIARDLMSPDEVRKLSNKKQIVFVAGYDPVMDDKYKTQHDPRFKEAKKLGHYLHVPNRGEEIKVPEEKEPESEDVNKDLFFKSLTAAEAEQLKKNGVKTVKPTENKEAPDYDLSEMENYEKLNEEKKIYLIDLMAANKIKKKEILDMFSGEMSLEYMKRVADAWLKEPEENKKN